MCRLLLAFTASLLVMGVLPKMTVAAPVEGGILPPIHVDTDPVCVPFNATNSATGPFVQHYCNRFNDRTTAFFPNPRGHKTPAEAAKEFAHFIPLLENGCSDKLGTLLCFIYFPFCTNAYPGIRIYPCKELCEEVTHDNSTCTQILRDYNLPLWNNALQCELEIYNKTSSDPTSQCASGVAPPYSDSTSPKATTVAPPPPTTPPADICSEDECPENCDYRVNANAGTFKRNGYCFAAKVELNSNLTVDCKNAYNVSVKEQFDLTTPFNTTHSTKAPSLGNSALILTSPKGCTQCPKLEMKKTYLIAGSYSKKDGKIVWELDGTNDNSLVTEWTGKYDRKLKNWIKTSNSQRQAYTNACEKMSELVTSEQWTS